MDLAYKKVESEEDIQKVYDYNIDAFSDSPDFKWSVDELKREMEEGWELVAVYNNDEVVAAVFYKVEGYTLLTKNTAIKVGHQGGGISHDIKDYLESVAREKKLKEIIHYCRIDNFRMYSLNESHGFEKTHNAYGDKGQVVEWVKSL
jgi:predicted GNAT family acetyltransferase